MRQFTRPMRWAIGLLIALPLGLAAGAHADVTIKQEGTISGLGGFMNSEMSTVTKIKGDKKCDDTEMRMTNKMMKMMGGGKPIETTSIIDLDKGVMYNVNHQDKSYTEMPLSAVGEMAGGMAQPGMYGQKKGQKGGMQIDTSDVTMSPPTFDIQKTGNSEKIDGHKCEETVLTMKIDGVDKKTGKEFTFTTVMNLWLANDVEGADEFNDFNKKMAEKMGVEASAAMNGSMAGALAMYGLNSEELREKMDQLQGFPLRTVATFDGEGAQFDEMNQLKNAGQDGDESQNPAAAKMLKGLFGGGGEDDEGNQHMMTMKLEVKDISTKTIDDTDFAPPAKYKQKKYDMGN